MKKRILSIFSVMALLLNFTSCADENIEQSTWSSESTTSSVMESTDISTEQESKTTTTTTFATETTTTEAESATTVISAESEDISAVQPITSAVPETSETTTVKTEHATTETEQTVTAETTVKTQQTTVETTTVVTVETTEETTVRTSEKTAETTVTSEVSTEQEKTDKNDFYALYEAENASIGGELQISADSSASGGKVVENFSSDSDSFSFKFEVPSDGLYDITFVSAGIGSYKENYVHIDGTPIDMFTCEDGVYTESVIPGVSIRKGEHELKVIKSWGWIKLDCIIIESASGIDDDVYNVGRKLVNSNANTRTKKLFGYLSDCYGKYILSGQVCDGGINGTEFSAIHDVTGKYPAILGLDMMDYTPSRTALGANSKAVERAIEFDKKGGIVTFCWHWNAPTESLKSGKDEENSSPRWWGGFYTRNTDFNFAKALDGSDAAGKAALDRDIAEIARQLNILEEAGVPVIWRPLHEASGGWFWWGAQGAESFKKLWIYLYEQLTYEYECNNLIWVFNGQSKDWYPGDKYVDIIGEDIYPGNRVYSPQTSRFEQATQYSDTNKIIALTENGCVFDIDLALQANVMWAWFNTWGGDFAVSGGRYSELFTEIHILKKAYDSKYVITLDELDW